MVESEPDNLEADLSAYLDGELSEDRAARVQAALKKSAEARRQLEQLRETARALNSLPRMSAPLRLVDQLQRITEGRFAVPQPRSAAGLPRILRVYGSWTAAAAAILLAFAAGRFSVEGPAAQTPGTSVGGPPTAREDGNPPAPATVASAQRDAIERSALTVNAADPAVAGQPVAAREAPATEADVDRIATVIPPADEQQDAGPPPVRLVETFPAAPGLIHIIVQPRTTEELAAAISTMEAWTREAGGSRTGQALPPSELVQAGSPSSPSEREQVPLIEPPKTSYSALLPAAGPRLSELIVRLESSNPSGIMIACRPSDVVATRQVLESISLARAGEYRANAEHRPPAGMGEDPKSEQPMAVASRPPDASEKAFGFARSPHKGLPAAPTRERSPAAAPAASSPPERKARAPEVSSGSPPGQGSAIARDEPAQRTLMSRIAKRLRDSLEAWLDLADEAIGRPALGEARPVLVRVTILPPDAQATATGAPAASPDTQPAPASGAVPGRE